MATLLATLGSYVPSYLVRRANRNPQQFDRPISERRSSVVLFADVSGFTALTERLATRGSSGAEDLTRLLNDYFGKLIDLVIAHGGDIVKFAGDAVMALWPAESAEDLPRLMQLVARCGLQAQEQLHDYPVATDVRLSLKLAASVGTVTTATLGGVFDRWEFLVTGPPLAEIGLANNLAQPGQVVLSPGAWELLRADAVGQPLADGYFHLTGLQTAEEVTVTEPPVPVSEAAPVLRYFIPAAIRTRLDAGQSDWLAELRRVTVLFVNMPDLRSETPLAVAQETIRALQTGLYRYEGSINKISVDDKGASLVAVLGLPPLSHEDDPVRGVRAALAMQEALRSQQLRSAIGVTTGLAFCGSVGSAKRREYTVMGDVVNLSARLMQAAPDDILCDGPTAQAAGKRVGFTALSPLKVKGKQHPLPVFRPAAPAEAAPAAPISSVTQQLAPLVGRRAERELFSHALRQLLHTRQNSCLVLEGEAGLGKSRLVAEALAQAQEAGVTALTGAGDAVEKSTPYYAWRQVFRELFQLSQVFDEVAATRTQVLNQLPADPEVLRLAPLLGVVLGLEWPDNDYTAQLAGKLRADQTHQFLARLLQEQAQATPTLLVLEDTHWLDSGSWALLGQVCAQVHPLFTLIATRPFTAPLPADYAPLWQRPDTQVWPLSRLAPDEIVALVCRRLGVISLPPVVAELVRVKAEGNPFFAEELAYSLRDAGLLVVTANQCALAQGAEQRLDASLPDTIQGIVTSRIDRLTPEQQLTLKVASVIGRVFSFRTLNDVHPIGSDHPHLKEHFSVLERLDLTPLESPLPDLAYIFKHIITRDVAYNLMLFSQRRQLHSAVARWYEANYADDLSAFYPLLAYHWREAIDKTTPEADKVGKAVDYFTKAGEQAVHNYLNQEAIRFFQKALELLAWLPESPQRTVSEVQLNLAVGAPLIATQGYGAEEVRRVYSRARLLCSEIGDDNQLFPALRGLWAYHIGRANYRTARGLAEQMRALAERQKDPSMRLEAHRALGNTVFWLGELNTALEQMERGIQLYVPDEHRRLAFLYGQDPDVANRGMQAWPLSLLGYPDQAVRRGQEAVAEARALGHPYSLGYAFVHDMVCQQILRLPETAAIRASEAIALGTEKGFPNWLLAGLAVHHWGQALQGHQTEAITGLQQIVNLWRGTGSELVLPYFLVLLAEAYGAAEQYAEAIAALDDALNVAARNDEHWYEAELYRLKAEYFFAWRGDFPTAERWLQTALTTARNQGARLFALRAAVSLCRLPLPPTKGTEVRHILREIYASFTEGHDLPDLVQARRLLNQA